MAIQVAVDEALLEKAMALGGFKTKRETVNEALRQMIQRHGRRQFSKLLGTIDFDPRYDYKRERRAR